jgi:Uma2 family endonuclease
MVLEAAKSGNERKQKVEYLTLKLPDGGFSDDQFYEFCQLNDNLKIERNSKGEIIILALTGGKTGNRNAELNAEFVIWNRREKQGFVFDSSTGFKLPNGATYSPDLAWISKERWTALSEEQKEKFVPLCPDFVIEPISSSQDVDSLEDKITEFIDNGCRLAWLIDPYDKATYVYRPKVPVEIVPFDRELHGGKVLDGLKIKLADIF